jgi:peptidoglycan/xylan/chitin deacetylase (PgdA/CDA1 family)
VLAYHRVAELENDPWQLAVGPTNFEAQLQLLQKKYDVISLRELIANRGKKSITSGTVCLTFDDGYRDNYSMARPLLEKYKCPATFFIATKYIEKRLPFWWDELQQIILTSQTLPNSLSLNFREDFFVFELGSDVELTAELREKQKNWIWTDAPPTRRCELYLALWKRMKPLDYRNQQSILDDLARLANCGRDFSSSLPMTKQHLKSIADHSLFDIGLHTDTHANLPDHSGETQSKEIAANETYLQDNCSNFLRALAFPNGKFNQTTMSIVEERKLVAAFTTRAEPVSRFSDALQLGRFHINDWNGEEFGKQLSAWSRASWDPERAS